MYWKETNDGYITSVGHGGIGDTEITEAEYNTILDIINNAPEPELGYQYMLKTDLTWEKVESEYVSATVEPADVMEKITALEEQNEMLVECIMEMSEIVYG